MVLDAMTLLAFMAHRDSVDIWQDGNPIDYWIDEYGFRCIRYESGRWWRYHLVGTTWKWFRLKHDGVYAEIKPDLSFYSKKTPTSKVGDELRLLPT